MPLAPVIQKATLLPLLVFVSSFYLLTESKEQVFYIMFGVLFLYFLVTERRQFFHNDPFLWGLLLVLAYYSSSTFWSTDPGDYFEKSVKHSVYILIFYICMSHILRRHDFTQVARWVLITVIVSGVIISLLSLFMQWPGYDFANRFTHSSLLGLTDNPIETGFFLGIASLAAIFFYRQSPDPRQAAFLLVATGMMICLLVITRSRGANLFFIVSVFLLMFAVTPSYKSRDSVFIILALSAGLFAALFIGEKVVDRVTSPNYRLDLIIASWDVAKEHLIFGSGWNPEDRLSIPSHEKLFSKPHNTFMQSLQVGGLVGLLLFLSLTLYVIYRGVSDKSDKLYSRLLTIWFIYGCLMISIDGGMFVVRPSTFWFYYWLPAFLIVCRKNLENR